MIRYSEIDDFNMGNRKTIFIHESSLQYVTVSYAFLKINNARLLTVDITCLDRFEKIKQDRGEEYALGIVLGYPPKCVEWFVNASKEEHVACGGLHIGSFSFKCPKELLDYAQDYMYVQHGLNSRKENR